jgi:hypothetical protein
MFACSAAAPTVLLSWSESGKTLSPSKNEVTLPSITVGEVSEDASSRPRCQAYTCSKNPVDSVGTVRQPFLKIT